MAISFATAPGRERQREREKDDDSVLEWEKAGNEERQFQKRERIRKECRAALLECAHNSRTAMTVADVQEYYRMGLSEESLTFAQTEEEKTRELLKYRNEYVPIFIRKAEEAGAKALALIDEAQRHHWITQESAERWRGRLKKESSWLEKRGFIEGQLAEFVQNWRKVREDTVEVAKQAKELGLTENDWQTMPELAALKKSGFWDQKYPTSRGAVDKAFAYLAVLRKDGQQGKEGKEGMSMKGLYALAEAKLKKAEHDGVLAEWKVGTWLKRIFGKEARKELIEQFVTGGPAESKATLSGLIRNWSHVRTQFDNIENKRGKEGTPRSFHFVSLNIFLGWDFEKRKAYVREADCRFTDIEKERSTFLRIRHALDVQDWEEAEDLIEEEWKYVGSMTAQDEAKLHSISQYLRNHRPKRSEKKEKPTDEELMAQLRGLMTLIPSTERKLHAECLKRGYETFWVNCTTWYNRVWLHRRRGVTLEQELAWVAEAEQKTPDRIKYGHTKKIEANDVRKTNNQQAAIRDQEDFIAPQILITSEESAENTANKHMKNKARWKYWYWTTDIPMESGNPLSYARHEFVVTQVHPQMKRLAREMEKRGILYTDSGSVQYRSTPTATSTAGAETSWASAA